MAYALFQRTLRGLCCPGFVALTLALCSPLQAAEGILLPAPPSGPGGEDSITTSQGVKCSQSINSSGGYLDVGIAASGELTAGGASFGDAPTALGYARVVIPLGVTPNRLDCSRLYEMEIERLQREIELLTIGLE